MLDNPAIGQLLTTNGTDKRSLRSLIHTFYAVYSIVIGYIPSGVHFYHDFYVYSPQFILPRQPHRLLPTRYWLLNASYSRWVLAASENFKVNRIWIAGSSLACCNCFLPKANIAQRQKKSQVCNCSFHSPIEC